MNLTRKRPVHFNKSAYTVLIVEDSQLVNNIIFDTMSKSGYSCHQAFNFQEAEIFLELCNCDIIILDLNLPDGQGADLIRNIQNLTKTKIVVLTSSTDAQLRDQLYQYGILDFYSKDDDIAETVNAIDRTIEINETNRGNSVLLIDDSDVIQLVVQTILEPKNYTLYCASNAQEGLLKLQQNSIDLVLLDMELPDMHGTELLKSIKHFSASLPVVALSGTSDPKIIRKVLKGGASDFIKKPFVAEELSLKVDIWIEHSRQQKQMARQQKFLYEYKKATDQCTAVFRFNLNGDFTYANDYLNAISGYRKNELTGRPFTSVFDPDAAAELSETIWQTLHQKKPWSGIVKNRTKEGHIFYTDTLISPIVNSDGKIAAFIGTGHNVTNILGKYRQNKS